ncbi:MAG: adenosine deaminase [Acidobacteria bacterium]|nr:MAG: adenosine deaminase [Acidobacteriota bacterium]
MKPVKSFIEGMPKAELHLHIEGTLEPELMFELALRNRVHLPFDSPDEARRAYAFSDLQSFLDIYYQGSRVLLHDRDFFDLTWAYLRKAKEQNIRHTEVFFDPQAHTARGVPIGAVIEGIHHALANGERELGISSKLILCFLRDLSAEDAIQTLESALPYRDYVAGVGLDSSERGHPPEKFTKVFGRARDEGFFVVAHAGEEGPPEYVWQALDTLGVSRIDHGVRAIEDAALVERLRAERVPLTVCPLSNVKLRVFDSIHKHNLPELLDADLIVTINSDDPAYFGGYINENFIAVQEAFNLTKGELATLARNSFEASFLAEDQRREVLRELDDLSAL